MFSIRPLISSSPSLFFQIFGGSFQVLQLHIGMTVNFILFTNPSAGAGYVNF